MSEYEERNPMQLDDEGGYYSRHARAMTSEKLFGKFEIASELGYRDKVIADLQAEIETLKEQSFKAGYLARASESMGNCIPGAKCIADADRVWEKELEVSCVHEWSVSRHGYFCMKCNVERTDYGEKITSNTRGGV